jgi:hypothetical protein
MSAWAIGGAGVSAAQSGTGAVEVPPAYAPPAGMCRVWLRDVPAVQQPAPTDCQTALRTKPVNATVLYGPESRRSATSPSSWSRSAGARDEDRTRSPFRSAIEPCGDLNRDRTCADVQTAPDVCGDGARDSRCVDAPVAMPTMRSAVLWTEGQRPADMQRWFGTQNVAARFAMLGRGASPDRVQWFDIDGRLVQTWIDRNGDGRADRVEVFNRDGARVRVIGQ